MKKLLILFYLFLFERATIKAQNLIQGILLDEQEQALPGANILVLNPIDSSLVKGGITDGQGKFLIENIENGSYYLSMSSIGFKTLFKLITLNSSLNLGEIKLQTEATELNELVVTSQKPLFEQKLDRLIVNPQSSITAAGGSALDVLERSPGVLVNRGTNTLSLNGKEGVLVMINGKVSQLSSTSLMQLLSGTSAANIEKIELISNPPAKYEAGSNGGIINIQLLKRTDLGTNGSVGVNAGYGQGEKLGANFNLNHRKGKINFFGDFSFSRNHWKPNWYNNRKINNGAETITIESTTYREPVNTVYNGRIGFDFQPSEKTVVGVFFTGFSDLWDMDALIAGSNVSSIKAPSFIEIDLLETGRFKNLMGNFNISQKIGQKSEINLDLDYLFYQDRNETTYQDFFSERQKKSASDGFRQTNKNTPIDIWVASIDFTHNLGQKAKLEAGLKGTTSSLTNEVLVRDLHDGELLIDESFSENSTLDEKIAGIYSSIDYFINEKTNMKLGLRYEFSRTRLGLNREADAVDLEYSQLFPTFFISRKLAKEANLQLSYGRRISRPSYSDLAPFFIFLDPSTFFYGNTSLTPAINDGFKLGVNYKQYLLTLEHTHEDNAIQYYQPVLLEDTNQQVFTTLNLNYRNTTSLILSLPFVFNSWWSMNVNFLGVKTILETQEDEKRDQNYYRINLSKTFKLPYEFSIEASGFYQSASLLGISRMGAYQNVNMGVQKQFSNNSKMRFSFNNIFGFTMKYHTEDKEVFTNYAEFQFEKRILNLSYTYSFGNEKLKKRRNRSTGSDEIRNRIK